MPNSLQIRVPASMSNLGPGFDCLGIAIQLYNTITVQRGTSSRTSHEKFGKEIASLFFSHTPEISPFSFTWSVEGNVPIARGLGSSVTLRLGILMGLNALCGYPHDKTSLFKFCTLLEGHADNAAPAVFGGFVLSHSHDRVFRCEVEETLHFVLLIPKNKAETSAARTLLPKTIAHHEARCNVANAAMLTAAFVSGDYKKMRGTFQDYLHQPYREHLSPGLSSVIQAGEQAGALGGFLSGSGSSIACISFPEAVEKVSHAMQEAHPEPEATKIIVTTTDNQGAKILSP